MTGIDRFDDKHKREHRRSLSDIHKKPNHRKKPIVDDFAKFRKNDWKKNIEDFKDD